MRTWNALTLAIALCLAAGGRADAQLTKLDGRVDSRTRSAVVAIIDSTVADGLPRGFATERLVRRALQRASADATSDEIIVAVRLHAHRLRMAADALRTLAPVELDAGAEALAAGVLPGMLERLRQASQGKDIAIPAVVLVDLIGRGLPVDTAATLVLTLAGAGTGDHAFLALRQDVARDMAGGAPPLIAAAVRTRVILTDASATSATGDRTSIPTTTGGGPTPRAPEQATRGRSPCDMHATTPGSGQCARPYRS